MQNYVCYCDDCHRTYFNWKKLIAHRIREHGATIELPDEGVEQGEQEEKREEKEATG